MGAEVVQASRAQGIPARSGARPRGAAFPRACQYLVLMLLLTGPLDARAEAGARDLTVMARAMAFLENPPTGQASVGIAFPRASEAGRQEADRVAAAFGNGLPSGRAVLVARPVAIEDLADQGFVAVLLTNAALPHAREAAAGAGRGVLTVATERGPVDAGIIVLAVRAEPRVEIIASRAAAWSAGIRFATAFRMLIQER